MKIKDLTADFAENYMKNRLRESTIRGYTTNLNNHLLPQIGDLDADEITPEVLEDLTKNLQKKLSNKSIIYIHATLRKILHYGRKKGYTKGNPYENYDLPKIEKYQYRTLKQEEIQKLLEAIRGERIEIPVLLATCYGLRRGECLGIIPSEDLDTKNNILHIQRTRSAEHGKTLITPCKTEQSKRYILLLPEHTKIISEKAKEGKYSFPFGSAILNKEFKKILVKNNLPMLRFHDLRHSYATLMMTKGVNPKIVSAVLGHSSVSITLDLYSHPNVTMQKICLEVLQKK